MTETVLITGSAGFLGGYLTRELTGRGYRIIGVDNYVKYGKPDQPPGYELIEGDACDVGLMTELASRADHLIANAAVIGGIAFFNAYAYDLLAANTRITAAACDAAIAAHRSGRLRKVTYLGSSAVYDEAPAGPFEEGLEEKIPPPRSAYGFSKLATEYYARAAYEQHGLPYTIVRPFNAIGTGETRPRAATGKMMGHVVPDLVQKVLSGQDPLRILGSGQQLRHYTWAGDVARGIAAAIEYPGSGEVFNLSSDEGTTVLELAELIWRKVRGPETPFRYETEQPLNHDAPFKIPSTIKARDLLGFQAQTSLSEALDEIIPWVRQMMADGRL